MTDPIIISAATGAGLAVGALPEREGPHESEIRDVVIVGSGLAGYNVARELRKGDVLPIGPAARALLPLSEDGRVGTISFDPANDRPYLHYLPTYAAIAHPAIIEHLKRTVGTALSRV